MANFCSKCGAQLTGGKFCPECGTLVDNVAQQTDVPVQTQQTAFTQSANDTVPQNPITPAPKKNNKKGCGILIAILAVLAVFLIFIFAISGGDDTDDTNKTSKSSVSQTTTEESVIEVSVEQILKDYEENEVSADNKYKGKKVAISGVVDSVSKDVLNDTYIKIDTGSDYEAFGAQCYIADTQLEKVAELKSGDKITVTGYVSSYSLNIVLKECEVQ